ncbi:MAG TPA: CotH kinase family protein [Mobilitalea sp.]|nr:CotH kinase family protein [Mobilitalea sp.]
MPKNISGLILMIGVITAVLFLASCKYREDTFSDDIGLDINKVSDINDESNKKAASGIKISNSIIVKNADNSSDEDLISKGYKTGVTNPGISFVQQDYFYKDTVYIEIISDRPCDIYYTMDGSDPDRTKELYRDKIELVSGDSTVLYCIKAKGYYDDGTETETIVHSYFVGKDVYNRFNTLVFSVISDPYNLYDYEYGILVEGKLRDEFIKNNPFKIIEPPDPANYNLRGRESEREVYLEVLEPDGTAFVSQKAGIRVYGGWSRANIQKSLKIYARKEYDTVNNKLRYEFFPGRKASSGDGTIITSFKRLVLRNCGNDNGFAFIRDELFQTLAGQAGYMDFEAVRPAALFINGEYRGHFWLHEVYCDEYFKEHYGKYTGTFEILEGGETFKKVDEDEDNSYAVHDYEKAYSYAYMDLTDDKIYGQLCDVIDVENYLSYYALQIFIGNEDWPHNNYKVYRYYAAKGEEYREAPFDGKWRYLLHDLDYSFGIYGMDAKWDNLSKFVSKTGVFMKEAPLFNQLMQREDCREFFIKKTLDLINGAFSPKNLNKVVDEMNASRLNEQRRMYDERLVADWVEFNHLAGQIERIKRYNANRILFILSKYREFFKLGQIYRLKVNPAESGGVKINGIETYSDFEGRYFPDYDTILTPILPAGKEFDYWIVDGRAVYDQELIINPSVIEGDVVEVSCVFKERPHNPKIIISEICSDGDKDYIMLYNPYEEDVSLLGYSITDNKNEPGKLILPPRILKKGEYLKILGEENREASYINTVRAGFNLTEGETVALYLNGDLTDEVTIPDLKDGSIYVRDMKTMRFYEVRNQQ